jgi:hypothetical protein
MATGAELRLVEPKGVVGHTRRFLPDSDYSPVAARLLRKADGTGLFLLVLGASSLGSLVPAGQYRLKLSYLRDNRAANPTSQVYSEAGNTGPENVNIDIPLEAS